MIFRGCVRNRDVQSGDTDACALGEAKATRWVCMLWMLCCCPVSGERLMHQMHTVLYLSFRSSLEPEDAK